MKRAWFIPLATLSVLLPGCSHSNPAPSSPPVVHASVVHSIVAQTPQTVQTTGTVHARETAVVSAQVPARIVRVLVQAGDQVRAGQTLAVLDDAAMQSALLQAQAGQAAAEKQQQAAESAAALAAQTLSRYQMLKEQKSVSPQEFDEVQTRSSAAQLQAAAAAAQVQQARAAVSGAQTQLGYTQLRAPFPGVITARMADPGTLAAPGVPLLQVDRDGPLQVYTTVDESLISSVRLGMKVPVEIQGAAPSGQTGTVAEIVPAADPASRSFTVKLDLPSTKGLRAGMYAKAQFPGATTGRSAVLAPLSAVVTRGSLSLVYALDPNGVAQLRYVTLGSRHANQVEILSGLTGGETLVNEPGDRDLAGNRIEAQ